jgi:membrane protease subunit (stomatin/prohibitin family)
MEGYLNASGARQPSVQPELPDSTKTTMPYEVSLRSSSRAPGTVEGASTSAVPAVAVVPRMKFCPECGTQFQLTAKFCCECGYKRL